MISAPDTRVIGIDRSQKMLAHAKQLSAGFSGITYKKANMRRLSHHVSPKSVDVFLALFAFCCLRTEKQIQGVLQQLAGVLRQGGIGVIQIPHPADAFFPEKSAWAKDFGQHQSYFDAGRLMRRRLRTSKGTHVIAARFHLPLSHYIRAIARAGFRIVDAIEPRPSESTLQTYPDLEREARWPSSIIFVVTR
jgi:SAM-dependent methyltransferase